MFAGTRKEIWHWLHWDNLNDQSKISLKKKRVGKHIKVKFINTVKNYMKQTSGTFQNDMQAE